MAPFTTFFGDYLHGLWITWTSEEVGGATGFRARFQANYRARMYTWGNSKTSCGGGGDTLASRDFDYDCLAGNTPWTTTQDFQFYVAWSNPNSTEDVSKDGILAITTCTLTTGADSALNQPTLVCIWKAPDGSTVYDLKPVANYDSPASVYDSAVGGTDNVTPD